MFFSIVFDHHWSVLKRACKKESAFVACNSILLKTETWFKPTAFIFAVPPFYVWLDLLGFGYSMKTMVVIRFANTPSPFWHTIASFA